MLRLSILQPLLAGLVLAALSVTVLAADTHQECADFTQPPAARRAACVTALGTATDPEQRARLLIQRAQTLMLQRNTAAARDAMADLDEAERLMPQMAAQMRAGLLVERAEINRLQGKLDAAFANVEEAERLAPADADPMVSRALLLFNRGDEGGGFAHLVRALELEPNHVRALYVAMRQARFTGDVEACVKQGTRALEVSPADTRVLGMRARCLAELGRADDAMTDLRKVEMIGPSMAYVLDDMALAYLALARPEEAVAAARRAIEMDPAMEDAHFDLISALMATGAHQDAIAAFRAFQAAGLEDRIGVASNLSWEFYLAERYVDALRIAEEWLAANPTPIERPNHIANMKGYPKVLDTAAHARAALGRSEEAVATFMRAAEMSPRDLSPLYRERLAARGFAPEPGNVGLEKALRTCVATRDNCKLYVDAPRSGPLAPP